MIFQKLSTISRSTMISYSYQVQIGNQCQLRILINCQIQSRVDFVENSTFVLSEALHFLRIGRILPLNTTWFSYALHILCLSCFKKSTNRDCSFIISHQLNLAFLPYYVNTIMHFAIKNKHLSFPVHSLNAGGHHKALPYEHWTILSTIKGLLICVKRHLRIRYS